MSKDFKGARWRGRVYFNKHIGNGLTFYLLQIYFPVNLGSLPNKLRYCDLFKGVNEDALYYNLILQDLVFLQSFSGNLVESGIYQEKAWVLKYLFWLFYYR